jgi:hypothetical protein
MPPSDREKSGWAISTIDKYLAMGESAIANASIATIRDFCWYVDVLLPIVNRTLTDHQARKGRLLSEMVSTSDEGFALYVLSGYVANRDLMKNSSAMGGARDVASKRTGGLAKSAKPDDEDRVGNDDEQSEDEPESEEKVGKESKPPKKKPLRGNCTDGRQAFRTYVERVRLRRLDMESWQGWENYIKSDGRVDGREGLDPTKRSGKIPAKKDYVPDDLPAKYLKGTW